VFDYKSKKRATRGFAVASVNYRLVPSVRYPAGGGSAKTATWKLPYGSGLSVHRAVRGFAPLTRVDASAKDTVMEGGPRDRWRCSPASWLCCSVIINPPGVFGSVACEEPRRPAGPFSPALTRRMRMAGSAAVS
jgi:hypothetical protein